MTAAILVGVICGLGCIGLVSGLHQAPLPLEALAATLTEPAGRTAPTAEEASLSARLGRAVTGPLDRSAVAMHPRWIAFVATLRIVGQSPEALTTKILVGAGIGLLGPPLSWALLYLAGVALPVQATVLAALVTAPFGAALPVMRVTQQAKERRHHFRVVLSSFVDLVVLSLAGGVGVEGALLTASQVSEDWAARRMARVLSGARQSGQSPWDALGRLGQEIGVDELGELSATLQLAGTEGARIRQSLTARAEAMRRHEQAAAESSANAMTERLFLPGALLLIGFLLFVGYPAFSRIVGGF